MDTTQMLKNVMSKKGQFGRAIISRSLKTRKGVLADIRKVTNINIRAGINYDNLTAVQEKRAAGELPVVNHGLPWGKWVAYPYLISHKGKHYVRLYPSGKPKVEYFMNGGAVDVSTIQGSVLASEISDNDADCITVNIDNLVELV